eukprot:5589846-Pleurochrysis_carterae.AAC.1
MILPFPPAAVACSEDGGSASLSVMTALVSKGSSFFPAKTRRAYELYDVNTCERDAARSINDNASILQKRRIMASSYRSERPLV